MTSSRATSRCWSRRRPGQQGRPSKALTAELVQAAAGVLRANGMRKRRGPYRLHAYVVLLPTGIRPEEARALRWDLVDLEAGTVAVCRSGRAGGDTKTARSRRTLKLPRIAVKALKERKALQAAPRSPLPPDAVWGGTPANMGRQVTGRAELVSHRDYYPGNVVFRDGLPVALIDFDLAMPTTRLYDIANALWYWAPLRDPRDRAPAFTGADIPHRVAVFADAYGMTARHRVIRKIWYNSPGSDHGSNASLNHEWVKLHNRTSRRVTLTGWTLRDAAGHVYTFGTYRLAAGANVKIRTVRGSDTRVNLFWGRRWYIWNNNGDTATLERPSGKVKSQCSYLDPHERRAFKDC